MIRFLIATVLLISNANTAPLSNDELSRRLDALSEEVMELKTGDHKSRTNFGGYGTYVYKNKRSEDQSNNKVANGTNPQADALRFILYISHDFSSKWKLTSEIEVEHANEIYLEQGTLDYLHSEAINFQAGVMLIPVGIINVYHEPTTFFGVNRPEVTSKLIPTTWRELGLSFFGEKSNFSYRLSLVDGLLASGFSSDGVRSGRQKASSAEARDLAWVGRLDYDFSGIATVGATAYIGKAGGVATDVSHKVYDLHADVDYKGLKFDAVYTMVSLGNTDKLNVERGLTGNSAVAEEMKGYWTAIGYNVLHGRSELEVSPFIRYEQYNTQDKVSAAYTKDKSKERTNITFGVNIKPLSNIVFKADYVKSKNEAKTGVDSWNLGMGWNF